MEQYKNLIKHVLKNGKYKENRTGVDTISDFSYSYKIDLSKGFPLLTTKDMSGYRWNSLIHEIIWYMSGDEHIKNLRKETKIWDAWANEKGHLDTAYGRFWRRYPVPHEEDILEGETWNSRTETKWDGNPDIDPARWINNESEGMIEGKWDSTQTFDQIQYVIDMLNENPHSRRLVVNAWHPANATVSTLPPCHYTFAFNVQGNKLNCHLTQRSGDIALGIPFNIACYSILTQLIAKLTGFELGEFSHSIVDAHIYCGEGERGEWYKNNLDELQRMLNNKHPQYSMTEVVEWISVNAPKDSNTYDHVPGLLKQCSRKIRDKPKLDIHANDIDSLQFEDFELSGYNPHDGIYFGVAE